MARRKRRPPGPALLREGRSGGVEMYELLLGLPILIMLVVLLVNGGYTVYANQVVQEAARSGCRVGVVSPNPGQAARQEAMGYGLLPGEREVFIGAGNGFLLCRVSYRVPSLVPLIWPSINVVGQTRMRMEGW